MGVEAPMLCKAAKSVPCAAYIMCVEACMLCKGAKSVPCVAYDVGVEATTPSESERLGQNLSLRASTLSGHSATVIHWHCTLFLLFF